MLNILFFLLLTFGNVESFEDNSKVFTFADVKIASGCFGYICRDKPDLEISDSPFKYTGETPKIVE